MKDIVLQGFVKNFAEDRGLSQLGDSTIFEAFATSSILRKFHQCDSSELEDVLTSGGGDGGIDAAIILVNGHPTKTNTDVDFFINKLRRLEVEFVFVQAKTTTAFDSSSIGTFVHGVSQFFSQNPSISFRQEVEQLRLLKEYIYKHSIYMEKNPSCNLYYVTTGEWKEAPEPKSRLDDGKHRLDDLNLFSKIQVTPVDANRLKVIYRELERGVVKEVEFGKIAVFPKIDGVQEAYIGLLEGDRFIDLITTAEGDLNRELFYDNVRDFQGHNPVNLEIAQTINDLDAKGRFPLFNNGITIVARSINRTGDAFRISDFQIVNGCQTSHILYQNRSAVTASTFVPIKLVVTDDSEIITEVIKATNRQTAVLPEALESLSPFQKELEDFYAVQASNFSASEKIYYERRSKQYLLDDIRPRNIVTLTGQTKSFVAMFLNEPHSHQRYYGELLKAYEPRLFVNDHQPSAYFASGYALLAIEQLFNNSILNRSMKIWKYHILMLLRIHIGGVKMPRLNSNQMMDYAMKIVNTLRLEDDLRLHCVRACQVIDQELKAFDDFDSRNPPPRLRAFTKRLMDSAADAMRDEELASDKLQLGSVESGQIQWFDDWKGFGFIDRDRGGQIFVHRTGISGLPWHLRKQGTRVTYTIAQDSKDASLYKAESLCLER